MSVRAATYVAEVLRREQLTSHFVRIVLGGPGLAEFRSTGIPDEWVALTIPGQVQPRYYTVRSWDGAELVLDIVVHEHGLVTEWASLDCVGQVVTISEPKGSFSMPDDASWLLLVGDLTALPAVARIVETVSVPVTACVETPDEPVRDYISTEIADRATTQLTWTTPPAGVETATADIVVAIDWPAGSGYFWMAGESAQMRAIRKHLMRERQLPTASYDVMGYWRGGGQVRQPRAVDPGPIWRAGKAAGKSDGQIWADYDAARESIE